MLLEAYTIKQAQLDFPKKSVLIDTAKDLDPSSNKKYVYWMVKTSIESGFTIEAIGQMVKWFDDNLDKIKKFATENEKRIKDANLILIHPYDNTKKCANLYEYSYEDLEIVYDTLRTETKKKHGSKTVNEEEDYNILHEDSKGNLIIQVLTWKGSVYWAHDYEKGKLTDARWCTSSYADDTQWKSYSKDSDIYIVILPKSKIPIAEKYKPNIRTAGVKMTDKWFQRLTILDNKSSGKCTLWTSVDIEILEDDLEYVNAELKNNNIDSILYKKIPQFGKYVKYLLDERNPNQPGIKKINENLIEVTTSLALCYVYNYHSFPVNKHEKIRIEEAEKIVKDTTCYVVIKDDWKLIFVASGYSAFNGKFVKYTGPSTYPMYNVAYLNRVPKLSNLDYYILSLRLCAKEIDKFSEIPTVEKTIESYESLKDKNSYNVKSGTKPLYDRENSFIYKIMNVSSFIYWTKRTGMIILTPFDDALYELDFKNLSKKIEENEIYLIKTDKFLWFMIIDKDDIKIYTTKDKSINYYQFAKDVRPAILQHLANDNVILKKRYDSWIAMSDPMSVEVKGGTVVYEKGKFSLVKITTFEAFAFHTDKALLKPVSHLKTTVEDIWKTHSPDNWECFIIKPIKFIIFVDKRNEWFISFHMKNTENSYDLRLVTSYEIRNTFEMIGYEGMKIHTGIDPRKYFKDISIIITEIPKLLPNFGFTSQEYFRVVYKLDNPKNRYPYFVNNKDEIFLSKDQTPKFLMLEEPNWQKVGKMGDWSIVIKNIQKII